VSRFYSFCVVSGSGCSPSWILAASVHVARRFFFRIIFGLGFCFAERAVILVFQPTVFSKSGSELAIFVRIRRSARWLFRARDLLSDFLIFPSVRAQGPVSSYFSAWSVLLACIPHGHGFILFPACLTFCCFGFSESVSCCEHLVNLLFFLVQQESTLFILPDRLLSPQF
jgi:hypothetical protein